MESLPVLTARLGLLEGPRASTENRGGFSPGKDPEAPPVARGHSILIPAGMSLLDPGSGSRHVAHVHHMVRRKPFVGQL